MIEAYKIVMRESASVRRAEELARKFKKQTGQPGSDNPQFQHQALIVSDEIEKLQQEIQQSLGEAAQVKLKRSLRQTKLFIVLKGSPEATEDTLQRIRNAILKP
jgi:hypothetical protein